MVLVTVLEIAELVMSLQSDLPKWNLDKRVSIVMDGLLCYGTPCTIEHHFDEWMFR